MMNDARTESGLLGLPTVAELAIAGRMLPLLTRAVVVGEAFRRAALAMHRVPSATLAGKDASGTPLIRQHRQAHYVADCRGVAGHAQDGALRVTHVVVYAPAGFLPSEVAALLAVRDLPPFVVGESGEPRPLSVTLCGLGQVAGLKRLRPPFPNRWSNPFPGFLSGAPLKQSLSPRSPIRAAPLPWIPIWGSIDTART
jgi:hypothetical protein